MTLLMALLLLGAPARASAAPDGPPALNEVPGLKLTANQVSRPGKLVVVVAQCDGPVAFDVVPVGDFAPDPLVQDKQVVLAPPPPGAALVVVAVGYTGGKFTRFAKSFVTSDAPAPGPTPPTPTPTPPPAPARNVTPPVHAYLVLDQARGDPNVAALAASQALLNALRKEGFVRHLLAANDPLVAKVQDDVRAAGGAPCWVLVDSAARVVGSGKLTASQDDVLAAMRKAVAK